MASPNELPRASNTDTAALSPDKNQSLSSHSWGLLGDIGDKSAATVRETLSSEVMRLQSEAKSDQSFSGKAGLAEMGGTVRSSKEEI
jgi:hypothetical protein